MNGDRFEQVKSKINGHWSHSTEVMGDVQWLIVEVSRLRKVESELLGFAKEYETQSESYETSLAMTDVIDSLRCDLGQDIEIAWQPIETAPKKNKGSSRIDLGGYLKSGKWLRVPDCYWHRKAEQWMCDHYTKEGYSALRSPFRPTHWMPKPTYPARSS